MASNTSVKRRRFWNVTADASASGWIWAVQRLRGDSCPHKWMLEFAWSCNPFCSCLSGSVWLQHWWWSNNVNWMISDTQRVLHQLEGTKILLRFILNKALCIRQNPTAVETILPCGSPVEKALSGWWRLRLEPVLEHLKMLKVWLGRFGLCRLRGAQLSSTCWSEHMGLVKAAVSRRPRQFWYLSCW